MALQSELESDSSLCLQNKFGKFREFIFPIYRHELRKFLPMSFLLFCILFVYALSNGLKDLFVQYNTNLWVGARPEETTNLISALKLWYVLPCTILAVIIFTALMNKFGFDKTFVIIVSSFIIFYLLFGYVIYPNASKLILSEENITKLVNSVPIFFRTVVVCFANLPFSVFYVFAELWGGLMISSLFWQFANRVTLQHEVTRFFGLYSLLSSIGTVLAGIIIMNYAQNLDVKHVQILMALIIFSAFLILVMFSYVNKITPKNININNLDQKANFEQKNEKPKVNSFDGIKILFNNSYLLFICVLIISYGISINFSEILLKAGMKEIFDKSQYAKMQGLLSIFTGFFSSVVVLFSANILRKFSWKVSALITPLAFLIAGGLFSFTVIYKQFISPSMFGVSSVVISAWFGIVYDAFVKSIKYSLFDTTKSMLYIPLDEDTKTKGQAAVELLGGRAGKAGSSAIQQVMFSFPRTINTVTGTVGGVLAYSPIIISVFFVTVGTWIFSVLKLSKKYNQKTNN